MMKNYGEVFELEAIVFALVSCIARKERVSILISKIELSSSCHYPPDKRNAVRRMHSASKQIRNRENFPARTSFRNYRLGFIP